jgi:serine/threonine-protein kinase
MMRRLSMTKSNPYEVQLVGEVIDGRYRIERLLGHGGMGTVWLARDERVEGRRVVVKVPRASFLEQEGFLDRFEREIQSLTRLDHPRIVKVLDVAHWKDIPVVVLQFLAGGSLAERTERPMASDEVVSWITPVAEGLDFIHSQDVIHRDVKPGNILFDGYGNAFLADFGIAKALGGEETGLTSTGASPGSPSYMAPEAGTPDALGPRYDQYSLACVVYKALSGRLPHEGRTALEVILKRTVDPPVPLRQAAPEVSAAVEAVVMHALARAPSDRFGSCRAFAAAFVGAVTGVAPANPPTDFTTAETRVVSKSTNETPRGGTVATPAPAGPVAAPTPVPAVGTRSKSRWIVAVAAAAVVAVGGVFAWNRFHGPGPGPGPGPVVDADQRFAFDPTLPRKGDAIDVDELVVRGTVTPPSTPEVDVGLEGDLRHMVPVGADGAVRATVRLPKEEGRAVVVVWTASRRELARLELEVDRTAPTVTIRPKEPRACSSDAKTFVASVDASELVRIFDESGRRELASAPAGSSDVTLELPGGATADPAPRTLRLVARDRCAHERKLEVAVETYDAEARLRRHAERRPVVGADLTALRGAELGAACEAFERSAQAWERDVLNDALLGARRDELLNTPAWKSLRDHVHGQLDESRRVAVAIAAPADAAIVNVPEIALHATVDPPGATVRVAVGGAPPREFTSGKDGVLDAKLALPDADGTYAVDVTKTTGEKLAHVSVVLDRTIVAKAAPVFAPDGVAAPIDRSHHDHSHVRIEFGEAVRVVVLDAAGAPLAGVAPQDFADGKVELDLPFPPVATADAVPFAVVVRVEDRLGNRQEFAHEFKLFNDDGRRQKSYDENVAKIAIWAEVVRRAPEEREIADPAVRERIAALDLPWLVRERASSTELVLVPPGAFEMGVNRKSPDANVKGADPEESPLRKVEIPDAFYVGRCEVTQEEWQRVTGANPSAVQDDPRLPVENVSFEDLRAEFLPKTGGLRLLTEAEWEYVARGAGKSVYPWGDEAAPDRANYKELSASGNDEKTARVGSFPKGASWCGVLDLAGNVWEWCGDFYDPNHYADASKRAKGGVERDPVGPSAGTLKRHVARGGSFSYFASYMRCTARYGFESKTRAGNLGFRVARTP